MGVDSDGVARVRTNKKKFDEGMERIFGKKDKQKCSQCLIVFVKPLDDNLCEECRNKAKNKDEQK